MSAPPAVAPPPPSAMPLPPAARSLDRRLFSLIQRIPHTAQTDRYVALVSDLGEGLGWVAAAGALAMLGGRRGRRAGLATALASLGTTYLVQRVLKPTFRRRRPFLDEEIAVVGNRTTDASFPSGHTASSFAAARALSMFYPQASPLVYGFATMVGMSRIYLGHHFPSDVVVGSLTGLATGTGCGRLLRMPKPDLPVA